MPSVPRRPSAAPRIALAQMRMCWNAEENTAAIVEGLGLAAAGGAQIGLFPELAITGIHRRIAEAAQPERVTRHLDEVRAACARHGIAACVGAPTFTGVNHEEGDACGKAGIRISQLFIDAQGRDVGLVHKRGLTVPEATFFVPAEQRPTLTLAGCTWSAMLCREIDDAEAVAHDLAAAPPQIVVWPGGMRPDPDKPRTNPPEHVQRAQAFARRGGWHVVMVNWPNALNRPEESAEAGGSVVIGPGGAIELTLPLAQAGLALFTLGERSFEWIAQAETARACDSPSSHS